MPEADAIKSTRNRESNICAQKPSRLELDPCSVNFLLGMLPAIFPALAPFQATIQNRYIATARATSRSDTHRGFHVTH